MLAKVFALSEQGSKNLKKGIIASMFSGMSLMCPMSLIMMLLCEFINPLLGQETRPINLMYYTIGSILIGILIFITHLIEYKVHYFASYEESANRRIGLAEKIRQLPLSFFGEHDLTALTTSMMGDCTELEKTFSDSVPKLFGTLITILMVLVGLFMMQWKMAIALFCVVPVAFVLVIGSKRIQDNVGTEKIEARLRAADGIQEYLENIEQIKACNQTDHYIQGLNHKMRDAIKACMSMEITTGTFLVSSYMVLRLGFPLVIITGATLLADGEITFLTYLVFLLAASRIYEPLTGAMNQIGEIFNAQLQINRMKQMQSYPSQGGVDICKNKGYDIAFDNVVFSYQEDQPVLKGVSFVAKQGEITALVGPSGGGKSTAAKLAARFWDIDSGKITLGGADISEIEPETLLKNYSIVFQDVVLFNDTVMENIRLGRKSATDEEVITAAKAAQCDTFINKLPKGYHTEIGENGAMLSGGERQRLSIARALLKDAPIILLDEATASLDVENETQIQKAISTLVKDKTVLIIAHRMRTVAGANKVVVLSEGKVAQQGSPQTLIKQEGLYKHLVELQKASEQWQIETNAFLMQEEVRQREYTPLLIQKE